jgi:hypothetical protein
MPVGDVAFSVVCNTGHRRCRGCAGSVALIPREPPRLPGRAGARRPEAALPFRWLGDWPPERKSPAGSGVFSAAMKPPALTSAFRISAALAHHHPPPPDQQQQELAKFSPSGLDLPGQSGSAHPTGPTASKPASERAAGGVRLRAPGNCMDGPARLAGLSSSSSRSEVRDVPTSHIV